MMQFGLAVEDVNEIKDVFRKYPNVKEVLLFGSRAIGNYKPGSDIDLAIAGDNIMFDEILEINNALDKLGMLYQFDLKHISVIKDSDVLAHIKRVGKILYP